MNYKDLENTLIEKDPIFDAETLDLLYNYIIYRLNFDLSTFNTGCTLSSNYPEIIKNRMTIA